MDDVRQRHLYEDRPPEAGALCQSGGGEQSAVGLTDQAELGGGSDAVRNQRLGDQVEIVEGTLLVRHAAFVPLALAELTAAAQVSDHDVPAGQDEGRELAEEGRHERAVEAAVAEDERGTRRREILLPAVTSV